jgi:hypothetical protein
MNMGLSGEHTGIELCSGIELYGILSVPHKSKPYIFSNIIEVEMPEEDGEFM